MDVAEKKRIETENVIMDKGEKLKKRLDEVNKNNNINYKETIEILQEKINQISNQLAISEEKNIRYENYLKNK